MFIYLTIIAAVKALGTAVDAPFIQAVTIIHQFGCNVVGDTTQVGHDVVYLIEVGGYLSWFY